MTFAEQCADLRLRVADAITRCANPAAAPHPTACHHDDGSFSIDWRLRDRRVALIIDRDPAESSWHAVSTERVGRMDCGLLATADLDELVAFVLAGV